MIRTIANEKALKGASKNAENAVNCVTSAQCGSVSKDEKIAWAMAAVIHCDMCRLIVAFDECERDGLARLLWMADLVSKLYEAKRWYFEKGARLLRKIAERKNCGQDCVGKKLKEIRSKYPVVKIDTYAKYRNKLGFHYDVNAIGYLNEFCSEDVALFHELLLVFSRFSGEWSKLTRSLIKDEVTDD